MEKCILDLDNESYYRRFVRGIDNFSGFAKFLVYCSKMNKVIPQNVFIPLLVELYSLWVRFKFRNIRRRYINAKDLLVNLGCGLTGKIGWVNVDIVKFPNVNCIYDCRKRLPLPNNSVKGIFCEHFLEHLDYKEEVPFFLSECYRVLKVGGVVRIVVPDAEKYLRAYCKKGWEYLNRIHRLDPGYVDSNFKWKYNTKLELINHVFRQGFHHKYAYDYDTLEFLLYKYSFSKVIRQDFRKSSMEELCIDQLRKATKSLYVEAVK